MVALASLALHQSIHFRFWAHENHKKVDQKIDLKSGSDLTEF